MIGISLHPFPNRDMVSFDKSGW